MTTHATVNITARPADPPVPLDDRLLRLFADPLRARLVSLLASEQLCTCHLAEVTGALPSAVSNQLRHLRDAGVVEREAAGRFTYYRLRPEVLDGLGAQLAALAAAARSAEAALLMVTGGPALPRRLLAEAVGTGLLVTVVVGSGIAATNLTPDDVGLQLFYSSTATAFGLTVLILLFGPASGAHFNPLVSAADWWLGRPAGTGLPGRDVASYTVAQTVGGITGALLANVMFDVPTTFSTHDRSDWHLWVGEVVATAGLVALIFALARTGRGVWAAPAVGAYIGAAYWFTSSTSFANPSVTVGRMFSDTFAGIEPSSVPGFVLAQLVGAALGVGLVLALYPRPTAGRPLGSHLMTTSATKDTTAVRPRILFACRANGGRSVASRVLAAYYGGDAVAAYSAGSEPGDHVHAEVADVLTGLGLDVSGEVPKGFDTSATYDVVVTQGCGESCPVFLGARYADWPLDDPKGQDEATVRHIVGDIDRRVRELLTELVPDHELPPSVFERSAPAR